MYSPCTTLASPAHAFCDVCVQECPKSLGGPSSSRALDAPVRALEQQSRWLGRGQAMGAGRDRQDRQGTLRP
eukprot:351122-Chlamydomonas_euryale.AAC.4